MVDNMKLRSNENSNESSSIEYDSEENISNLIYSLKKLVIKT